LICVFFKKKQKATPSSRILANKYAKKYPLKKE
jgi:hypothetical protein